MAKTGDGACAWMDVALRVRQCSWRDTFQSRTPVLRRGKADNDDLFTRLDQSEAIHGGLPTRQKSHVQERLTCGTTCSSWFSDGDRTPTCSRKATPLNMLIRQWGCSGRVPPIWKPPFSPIFGREPIPWMTACFPAPPMSLAF